MEPIPRLTRETTPPLRPRSLGVRRQQERVVGFEEAPNREGSRTGRNVEGKASKDQKSPHGTTTKGRKAGIGKKDKGATPTKAPILMIRQKDSYTRDNVSEEFISRGKEITFPSVTRGSNSSAPVIIKAKIFGREVGQVHMDSEISCEVIYEHRFIKLKPFIIASKIDSKVPLIGFSGDKSWSSREIPLEITIGDPPLARRETLNFVIVRFDSPYNMLLGRTTMQKMGIVVSTIYGAIKLHTPKRIRTVFSTHEYNKIKGVKKVRETPPASIKGVLSCAKAEEKVVINDRYLKQIVTIRKQLLEHFKERLTTACKEVEQLTKAVILQKFKHQTWVANPVMVKKSDRGWSMRRGFLLPKDAFALKNAGVTYQRLVDKVFYNQIGRNLEAYVDDMSLNGKLAALSRFLSRGAEMSLPFFKTLKSCIDKKNIRWMQEAEVALQEIKKFMENLLMLTAPMKGEVLIMYLTASTESISASLLIKREGEQVPIYFVSRVLQGAELDYPALEKLILALNTKEALKGFDSYMIEHIRRNQNKKVDTLSKMASMTSEHLTKEVLIEVLAKRSIKEKEILQVETNKEESWMTPIHEYLVSGLLPKDPNEARKIKVKAPRYKLIRGSIYRRGTLDDGQNYEAMIFLANNAQNTQRGYYYVTYIPGGLTREFGEIPKNEF
nr:hypothetical protein [Tanacetum cinerariifolium]